MGSILISRKKYIEFFEDLSKLDTYLSRRKFKNGYFFTFQKNSKVNGRKIIRTLTNTKLQTPEYTCETRSRCMRNSTSTHARAFIIN